MKTIVTTSRGIYRCTRYFDRLAKSDHIMIEKRRTFLGIPIGWRQVDVQEATFQYGDEPDEDDGVLQTFNRDLEKEARFAVYTYEQGLVTSALLKNL